MEQAKPLTRLANKHYSPLVLRKYTRWGPPLYVALITDDNLDDLDQVVEHSVKSMLAEVDHNWEWPEGIQAQRDLAGGLTEQLMRNYKKVEGAAVILYADKMFVASLHGDFMTHAACKQELYFLLQMSTGV